MRLALACLATLTTACTTLGPMPVHTGISPVPADRTEVEVQVAAVPGYYLSSGATDDASGSAQQQAALLFQPGSLLGVRGLFVSGRLVGPSDDVQVEPMLGYRRSFGDAGVLSLVGVAYGTRSRARDNDASYRATRAGAEVGVDLRLIHASWIEPHIVMGVSATALSAEGTYCVDSSGRYGVDCSDEPDDVEPQVDAEVSGLYPAFSGGVALRTFHRGRGTFHGGRVLALVSMGLMPRLEAGDQTSATAFVSGGLAVSFAFGVRAKPPAGH
jgi:hypothetical protein